LPRAAGADLVLAAAAFAGAGFFAAAAGLLVLAGAAFAAAGLAADFVVFVAVAAFLAGMAATRCLQERSAFTATEKPTLQQLDHILRGFSRRCGSVPLRRRQRANRRHFRRRNESR
jgi:membrane protein implicated in regulation of membrane protease activity